MDRGMIDVFAFQEALLIEVILGITILVMIYAGFRRWLQYKERMGRLIAEQTAERAAQYGAHIERVEERLKALEQTIAGQGAEEAAQIDASGANPLHGPMPKRNEV